MNGCSLKMNQIALRHADIDALEPLIFVPIPILPPPGLQGVWYCSAVGPLPATGGTVRRANLAGDTHDEAPCRARSPAASPNGSRRTAPVCPHAGKPPLSNPPTALERGGPAHRNPFPPRPGDRTSRLDQLTTSPDANLSPLGRSPSQPPSPKQIAASCAPRRRLCEGGNHRLVTDRSKTRSRN